MFAVTNRPDLVCPAGTPSALRDAVDAGADSVYCGFQNATNARNFPGLNFTLEELRVSIAYAHARGAKVLLAVNTFPPAGKFECWRDAIDAGAALGIDAIIVADIGVAAHAARAHPQQRLHLSVQASASSPEAIRYYCREFAVKRVVLPRILTVPEIKRLAGEIPCEIETFIFGNHGLMLEGRCSLTNYATGLSTNMDGVCSPAAQVRFEESDDGVVISRLGAEVIDCFKADESAGYPTICKGRYTTGCRSQPYYAFEEPVTLNLAPALSELIGAGVQAFKIEGRQRSRAYVRAVVSAFRQAIDAVQTGREPDVDHLIALAEGQKQTEGASKTKKWR
jgi:putative protease